jgi:hypothetical protein
MKSFGPPAQIRKSITAALVVFVACLSASAASANTPIRLPSAWAGAAGPRRMRHGNGPFGSQKDA